MTKNERKLLFELIANFVALKQDIQFSINGGCADGNNPNEEQLERISKN